MGVPRKPLWPFTLNAGHDQANGLVGWWPGAAPGGPRLIDMSGKGSHGVLTNFGSTPGSGWAAGYQGGKGALICDGSNDLAATSLILDVPFSVCFWLKSASNTLIVGNEVQNVGGFVLGSNAGNMIFQYSRAGAVNNVIAGTVTFNVWQHYACTLTAATHAIYLNGRGLSSGASTAFVAGSNGLRIGGGIVGSAAAGTAEDLRAYNRCLTAGEVADIYRNPWALRYQPGRRSYFVGGGGGGNRRRRVLISGGGQ
jgi:hypothetical protein